MNTSEDTTAQFTFDKFYIEERPSFYDFLHSGWQINLTVAIDFTASNGPVGYPDSLHYVDRTGRLNQYQSALYSIGGILENYDSDNLIAAFGFGGIPQKGLAKEVSHCFHLNGFEQPEWKGLQGLMEAYNFSLANVKLYGPTYFSPWIETFVTFVQENLSTPLYHILLIMTDGDIHDMDKTKDLIVAASLLPISIIIVGIGDENFELMVELDGDEQVLRSSNGNNSISFL